jgi:hypothetical protein
MIEIVDDNVADMSCEEDSSLQQARRKVLMRACHH